jgi:hypothetical protein
MSKEEIKKFEEAPVGTIIFFWGKGIIANGIRFFQKLESMSEIIAKRQKYHFDFSLDQPTHVAVKVDDVHIISAEMKGVKKLRFDKYIDGDECYMVLAKPIIRNNKHKEWQSRVAKWLEQTKGHQPYDFKGFFSFIFRALAFFGLKFQFKTQDWEWASFCSELGASIFTDLKGGNLICDIREDASTISPEELLDILKNCRNMNIECL